MAPSLFRPHSTSWHAIMARWQRIADCNKFWRKMAIAEYMTRHLEPRSPFTSELLSYPRRSQYYEVFVATWTLPTSVLLIYSLEYLAMGRFRFLLKKDGLMDFVQFFIFVAPFQICVLDYPTANYTRFALLFNAACYLLYFICYLHRRYSYPAALETVESSVTALPHCQLPQRDNLPYNDCLTGLRSIVYISTAVCIFARDQPCWNNDFSKADTFGTGLMDIGLGCFVVCIGSLGPTATKPRADVKRSIAMKKAWVQFLVLTVCGLIKSIAVVVIAAKNGGNVKFENSWREYGVHWNAFYSLAVAKLAGTALELLALPDRLPPLLAAVAAGLGHEALLAPGGLAVYVLAPGIKEPHNRTGLLGANREGICSAPGLVALYLVGLQLGRWTHAFCQKRRGLRGCAGGVNSGLGSLTGCLAALLAGCLAYRVLLAHLPRLLLPESRRLLNLSYCAWIAAFAAFCLLNACLLFAARPALLGAAGSPVPLHLRRVDSAGLIYFLASNLLTGLANLLIGAAFPDRESTDGPLCFLIVLLYMAVVYPVARLTQRLVNIRALIGRLTACLC